MRAKSPACQGLEVIRPFWHARYDKAMEFVIDAFLPATLTSHPMSDEEFAALCDKHPDLFFEMTAEAELLVMPPHHSLTGAQNSRISRQLDVWAEQDGRGIACDSSTGFLLPSGARRSPDASWTLKDRIAALDPAIRKRYWHLCPDFVIELQSTTDRPQVARAKMQEWISNGAQLGWLIDPERRAVTIYRLNGDVETRVDAVSIAGEGPVAGFILVLGPVWNPLGG